MQADLRHLLPQIKAPCLLLWSQEDLTTPLSAAQEMAATIANSKIITVKEGFHEWGLWYPEKLTALVLDFIHQVEQSKAIATGRSMPN